MIGFYIKAAGLERELERERERELLWRAEVNTLSLNDSPFSVPPSVHSKLFLRSNHIGDASSDALSQHTSFFFN